MICLCTIFYSPSSIGGLVIIIKPRQKNSFTQLPCCQSTFYSNTTSAEITCLLNIYHTAFQDHNSSDNSVVSASQVCIANMLLLLSIRNWKVRCCSTLQWLDVHKTFHQISLTGSKVAIKDIKHTEHSDNIWWHFIN